MNVLAYGTRCVGAEGCLRRPDLPLPQVLCDGLPVANGLKTTLSLKASL